MGSSTFSVITIRYWPSLCCTLVLCLLWCTTADDGIIFSFLLACSRVTLRIMYEQSLTTFSGKVGRKWLKQQLQAFCGCSWLPSWIKIVYIFWLVEWGIWVISYLTTKSRIHGWMDIHKSLRMGIGLIAILRKKQLMHRFLYNFHMLALKICVKIWGCPFLSSLVWRLRTPQTMRDVWALGAILALYL